jgi:hypothetical protein
MELPLDASLALANLPFGSPKSSVRTFFGGQPQPFHRTPASREEDYRADVGVFASYDEAGALEALEFAAPAEPSVQGQLLTSLPMRKAKELLQLIDDALAVEAGAATSKKWGISVWSGAGDDGVVQSVLRFASGYYD